MDRLLKFTIALITFSSVITFLSALSITQQHFGWYIHLERIK